LILPQASRGFSTNILTGGL